MLLRCQHLLSFHTLGSRCIPSRGIATAAPALYPLADLQKFLGSPRFEHISRPYTAERLQPLIPPVHRTVWASDGLALKFYSRLREHQKKGTAILTFGALDPLQTIQMAPYVEAIYVGGWNTAVNGSKYPSPDVGRYSWNAVPDQVERIFNAQEFHDRKQRFLLAGQAGAVPVDYFRPIFADGDAGFGGVGSVLDQTRAFIEKGAAGAHWECQRSGEKKCGHLGQKVLVSMQEHIDRLVASRLQADTMLHNWVIIARTDGESASFIDNDIDGRDHPFIIGNLTVLGMKKTMTFPEAVLFLLSLEGKSDRYREHDYYSCSIEEGLERARYLIKTPFQFDWRPLRSKEGYYPIRGGTRYAIHRAIAFSPYADLLWFETSTPNLNQALAFSEAVHAAQPSAMLAYNCSPSFAWRKHVVTDQKIRKFCQRLAAMPAPYVLQFITLAAFHTAGRAITNFARALEKEKMLAYVKRVQDKEEKEGLDLLKHQKWSGVHLHEEMVSIVTNGSGMRASHGMTECQFDHGRAAV